MVPIRLALPSTQNILDFKHVKKAKLVLHTMRLTSRVFVFLFFSQLKKKKERKTNAYFVHIFPLRDFTGNKYIHGLGCMKKPAVL